MRAALIARAIAAALAIGALWLAGAAPARACIGLGCTCSVSAQNTAFGLYDPFSAAPNDTTGALSVTCSALVAVFFSYDVKLSAGIGGYGARRMESGAEHLNYQLYTNAARTLVWGDGASGTTYVSNAYALSVLLLSRTDDYFIYGRAPAAQNAKPGAYADTIVVTVEF